MRRWWDELGDELEPGEGQRTRDEGQERAAWGGTGDAACTIAGMDGDHLPQTHGWM